MTIAALPTNAQVTGSGTASTLTKWTGSSTVGDSAVTETNGAVVVPAAGSFGVGGAAPSGYPFFATSVTPSVSAAIKLRSNFAYFSTSFIGNFGTYGTYISHNREPQAGGFVDMAASPNQHLAGHIVVGDTQRMRLFQVAQIVNGAEAPRLIIDYNGNMTVSGNITGAKVIGAVYQDLAEWVPATNDMAPGTVVVLNAGKTNEVMPSARQYDTTVAGVVSANPGIILGTAGDDKEQIATTGRVKVRVDARSAAIRVGDLLVTSDIAGTAMRSQPMEINGRQFHQPGTIIGKALEPLEGGIGEILVLLSMQ
jgi:hypothetical protein